MCKQGGNEATCGDRLNWVSQHQTNHEANICEAAAVLVIADCPEECGACTAEGAGCDGGSTMAFVKRYDAATPQSIATQPMIGHHAALAAAGAMLIGAGLALRARSRQVVRREYNDVFLVEDAQADDA